MTDDELREEDEFSENGPEDPESLGEDDELDDLEEEDGFDDEDPDELEGFRVEGENDEEERDF